MISQHSVSWLNLGSPSVIILSGGGVHLFALVQSDRNGSMN